MLIQKASSIMTIKNTAESPRLILKGLYILDFHKQDIAWFGSLNLERTREIVNLGKVDVLHVVS